MHFEPKLPYHVYNRGNNHQRIFFRPEHYLFFLRKIRREWHPHCDVLAWCLMPNHFHFVLAPKPAGCTLLLQKGKEVHLQALAYAIGKTLSSYTRAINKEQDKTGVLFQKKTKAKCLYQEELSNCSDQYLFNCICYVHQNPVEAGLVAAAADWPFSSAADYLGKRAGTLCNKSLLYTSGGFTEQDLQQAVGYNADLLAELLVRQLERD